MWRKSENSSGLTVLSQLPVSHSDLVTHRPADSLSSSSVIVFVCSIATLLLQSVVLSSSAMSIHVARENSEGMDGLASVNSIMTNISSAGLPQHMSSSPVSSRDYSPPPFVIDLPAVTDSPQSSAVETNECQESDTSHVNYRYASIFMHQNNVFVLSCTMNWPATAHSYEER